MVQALRHFASLFVPLTTHTATLFSDWRTRCALLLLPPPPVLEQTPPVKIKTLEAILKQTRLSFFFGGGRQEHGRVRLE